MAFGGVAQALGNEGAMRGMAKERNREISRQRLQDRMAQLQQLLEVQRFKTTQHREWVEEQMGKVGQPLGQPVQGKDKSWYQLVRDPQTGKYNLERLPAEYAGPQGDAQKLLDTYNTLKGSVGEKTAKELLGIPEKPTATDQWQQWFDLGKKRGMPEKRASAYADAMVGKGQFAKSYLGGGVGPDASMMKQWPKQMQTEYNYGGGKWLERQAEASSREVERIMQAATLDPTLLQQPLYRMAQTRAEYWNTQYQRFLVSLYGKYKMRMPGDLPMMQQPTGAAAAGPVPPGWNVKPETPAAESPEFYPAP